MGELEWILEHSVGADGGWPESTRYHVAVLNSMGFAAKVMERAKGENWFENEKLRKMYDFMMRIQMPPDAAAAGIWKDRADYPPVGDADYSQIELRVLAHISGDEQLIEAYKSDADIHRITASKVFHTPFEEVTDLQRRNAKAVNFGIVYGISSFGLSQDLSITRKEAATYIEQYFATYPQVKTFLDKQVEDAKQNGYVTTLYGRRRPIPELKSSNFMQRSFGERVAMNSPIQGTAADIMKLAMIHVWEELHRRKLNSRLSLQIHDELLIETDRAEATEVAELLKDKMKHAAELSVSLEVDLHTGENWYDAK